MKEFMEYLVRAFEHDNPIKNISYEYEDDLITFLIEFTYPVVPEYPDGLFIAVKYKREEFENDPYVIRRAKTLEHHIRTSFASLKGN